MLKQAALIVALLWPSLGGAVSGSVEVEGRVVPLPPGEWQPLGRAVEVENLRYTGQQYRIGKAQFVQERDGRVSAMVIVWVASSNPGTTINWQVSNLCRRQDLYAQMTRSADQQSQDCLGVSTAIPRRQRGQNVAEEWRPYYEMLDRNPDWIPRVSVWASFRIANQFNILNVEYSVSPEAAGFPADTRAWGANAWNPNNLRDERRAYVEKVVLWAMQARPIIWEAFQRDARRTLPGLPSQR